MENEIIKEWRKKKSSKLEPNRTRIYIQYKCFSCGEITEVALSNFKKNKPCPKCRRHLAAKERFFKVAKEKFGDAFDLSKVNFVDSSTKVEVRCIKHDHTYWINPTSFIAKSYEKHQLPHKGGCKYCAIEASKEYLRKPISHYLNKLKEKFPHFKVISHGEGTSNTERITLECPNHGIFTTTLAKIMSNRTVYLCPQCSREQLAWNTGWSRTDVKGTLYFVYLKELDAYKLGATHRPIKRRLIEIKHDPQLLWTVELDTLADAFLIEMHLFRKYHNIRFSGEQKFGGYSELLKERIEKPTKGFIEEILCLKESNSGEVLTSNVEDNPEQSPEMEMCRD